jgi:hypothetical protein
MALHGHAQTTLNVRLKNLYDKYEQYKVSISSRKFKHAELLSLLQAIQAKHPALMRLEQIGQSVEGRSINLVTFGKGKTKLLLWSQMHGDESTATMALLDAFNYLVQNADSRNSGMKTILEKTTIYVIPMLNPDGAERFIRRNAQGIDVNRDALRLQTPEGKILKMVRDKYRPDFGFNLHDQDPQATVGTTKKVATIALLAPAYNVQKSTNAVRKRAKLLVAFVHQVFAQFIPGHVSRYDDTFEPRAFGDNIQKWGTSTILIESGGWKDDPEKQYIRKLNYVALLASMYAIATKEYAKADVQKFEALQENSRGWLYDLIIKNSSVVSDVSIPEYICDVAVNFETRYDPMLKSDVRVGRIVDMGDLSTLTAHTIIDATGMKLMPGAVQVDSLSSNTVFERASRYIEKGVTTVICRQTDGEIQPDKLSNMRLNYVFLSSPQFDSVLNKSRNGFSEAVKSPEFWKRHAKTWQQLGLQQRGKIEMGAYADFVLTVSGKEKPSMVFVNGVATFQDGKMTENRAGVVLKMR